MGFFNSKKFSKTKRKELTDVTSFLRSSRHSVAPQIFEFAFEATKEAMVVITEEGVVAAANSAFIRDSGYSKKEIAEIAIWRLIDNSTQSEWQTIVGELQEKGTHRISWKFPRGKRCEAQLNWHDEDALIFGVLRSRELTIEEPQTLQTLRFEKNYQSVIESSRDLIVRMDLDGRFTFVNDAYCRKCDKSKQELIGQQFIPQVHPDDVESVFTLVSRLKKPPYAGRNIHRSWTREGWRWFHWEASAILNDEEKVVGIQGFGRDITEERKVEESLRRKTEELERRNEELEQFAYIASHDLKEPLRMVYTFLELFLLRHSQGIPEDGINLLKTAQVGAKRMIDLIQGLLSYAQLTRQIFERRPVSLQMAADRALFNLQLLIRESSAKVKVEINGVEEVYGNLELLSLVFEKLIENGIKYHRPGINANIQIRAKRVNNEIVVSIEDNGIGFSSRHQDRIFQIFQRLHARSEFGGGIGTGLTTARCIVGRHEGRIWTDSKEGVGSTFHFSLPTAMSRSEFPPTEGVLTAADFLSASNSKGS